MLKVKLPLIAAALVLFSACNTPTEEKKATEPVKTETETVTDTQDQPTETKGGEIVLNANDQMQFDKKEIRVKGGEKIKLTLNHTGKMDKKAMGHNFVLLHHGLDPAFFGPMAAKFAETDYIPKSELANIIAHTRLLGGGESDTIEFDAPEPGVYTFMCTFPGHWGVMQGKFIVE